VVTIGKSSTEIAEVDETNHLYVTKMQTNKKKKKQGACAPSWLCLGLCHPPRGSLEANHAFDAIDEKGKREKKKRKEDEEKHKER